MYLLIMGGEVITLGFFNDEYVAHQHILKFLEERNCEFQVEDNYYSATYTNKDNKYCHFKIHITEYTPNEIKIPYFMDS